VGAGVLVVAVTLVHVGVHWLTDVIGGALLAALFVTLGAEVIRYFHVGSARNSVQNGAQPRSTTDATVLSAGH
jgi:undecaprenyl-diphosphatase